MNLVIIESPAKGKTIEKFLGKEYQVLASFGHVRDLPRSKLGIDVENDFKPQYLIIQKARKNLKILKEGNKKLSEIFPEQNQPKEKKAETKPVEQ